jgi:hypothetical protein
VSTSYWLLIFIKIHLIRRPPIFLKLLRYPTAPPGSSSVRSNTYILTESFPIPTCMGALPHPKTIARS